MLDFKVPEFVNYGQRVTLQVHKSATTKNPQKRNHLNEIQSWTLIRPLLHFYSAATILITKTGRSTQWNGTSSSLGLVARWKNKKKPLFPFVWDEMIKFLFLGPDDQLLHVRPKPTKAETNEAQRDRAQSSGGCRQIRPTVPNQSLFLRCANPTTNYQLILSRHRI